MRIYRKYYGIYPQDRTTIVIPGCDESHVTDVNSYVNGNNSNNKESSMSSLEYTTAEEEEDFDTENFIENHVMVSNQDTSFDQTEDNIPENQGFFTTHSGNSSVTILQDKTRLTITGHVIFNQVGTCTRRRKHNIEGASRQNHLVQNLCATIPGHESPLLQPEASLFYKTFLHCYKKRYMFYFRSKANFSY